jgi:hypothetical protein
MGCIWLLPHNHSPCPIPTTTHAHVHDHVCRDLLSTPHVLEHRWDRRQRSPGNRNITAIAIVSLLSARCAVAVDSVNETFHPCEHQLRL